MISVCFSLNSPLFFLQQTIIYIKSFFKRRAGKKRGEDWIPFDQLDFVLGVLFFSFIMAGFLQVLGITTYNWFIESFTVWHILTLLVITPFFHIFANFVHRKIKSKQVA